MFQRLHVFKRRSLCNKAGEGADKVVLKGYVTRVFFSFAVCEKGPETTLANKIGVLANFIPLVKQGVLFYFHKLKLAKDIVTVAAGETIVVDEKLMEDQEILIPQEIAIFCHRQR